MFSPKHFKGILSFDSAQYLAFLHFQSLLSGRTDIFLDSLSCDMIQYRTASALIFTKQNIFPSAMVFVSVLSGNIQKLMLQKENPAACALCSRRQRAGGDYSVASCLLPPGN